MTAPSRRDSRGGLPPVPAAGLVLLAGNDDRRLLKSQDGLAALAGAEAARYASLVDTTDTRRSTRGLSAALLRFLRERRAASHTLAGRFYLAKRIDAGVPGTFTPLAPPLLTIEQVEATVGWAAGPLYQADPDMGTFEDRISAAAERLVLDAGRSTVIESAKADRQAWGWARVPEANACYFCALLATRGAVYKQDTAGFRAHDHCRCHAEPVFNRYEPSAEIREWESLYAKSTKGVYGMRNLQIAFRRAYEGRTAPKQAR